MHDWQNWKLVGVRIIRNACMRAWVRPGGVHRVRMFRAWHMISVGLSCSYPKRYHWYLLLVRMFQNTEMNAWSLDIGKLHAVFAIDLQANIKNLYCYSCISTIIFEYVEDHQSNLNVKLVSEWIQMIRSNQHRCWWRWWRWFGILLLLITVRETRARSTHEAVKHTNIHKEITSITIVTCEMHNREQRHSKQTH